MEYPIHIGDTKITLMHDSFEGSVNVDDLTKIDTSNIFGEAVTISAAVNRIGLMKAQTEANMATARLKEKIYESNFRAKVRKEAANNGGFYNMDVDGEKVKIKISETFIKTCYESDAGWIAIKEEFIKSEKQFNFLSSVYWAAQDKSRKLNGLVNNTTPEDFVAAMIEGKVNGILIKK